MAKQSSNARLLIRETDGIDVYYNLHLDFVPRVGELISLKSVVDWDAGYPSEHLVEVKHVIHTIGDLNKQGEKGYQYVLIYAQRTTATFTIPDR